jgi:hypothetical protein
MSQKDNLKKAMKAYDYHQYRKCLEYIKNYQGVLETYGTNPPYNYNKLTREQKVLIYIIHLMESHQSRIGIIKVIVLLANINQEAAMIVTLFLLIRNLLI